MSVVTANITALLSAAPIIAANPAANISAVTWGGQYSGDISVDVNANLAAPSGVYAGSISSQGNMLAMQLNVVDASNVGQVLKFVNKETGERVYPTSASDTPNGVVTSWPNPNAVENIPWMDGFFRAYFRDPTKAIFGANTAIPALTGVMPERFTDMQGNFVYYVDLQLMRLSGNNHWDNFYFINAFNQCLSWVLTTNQYAAGALAAEANNLSYYGFNSYDDLVTQGFNKYKASEALITAFSHMGFLVQYIPEKFFGTANQVAKALIDFGLGAIGNFADQLYIAGVNYDDIYNPNYTKTITALLGQLTNTSDLEIIQSVLQTSVPHMVSPLDYLTIEGASGRGNDSGFKNMAEVGADLYLKAPNFTYTVGSDVARLIADIQNESSPSIENLKTNDGLLTPELLAQLRTYLPLAANNAPVSILNVIGSVSGYYTEQLELVNEGIAELYATDYGPQIRDLFTSISRFDARVPLTEAEALAAANYVPVPPPVYSGGAYDGDPVVLLQAGGPDYWEINKQNAIAQYYALVDQIANDIRGNLPNIVQKINSNYDYICELLYMEHKNYIKANITVSSYADNSLLFNFVTSVPSYGEDSGNIGTDYLLYGICQPTVSGNVAQTLLGQSKNNAAFANAAVKINGLV